MPSISRRIPKDSDLHKRIIDEVRSRVRMAESKLADKRAKWSDAEDNVLAFLPERENDRLRKTARDGSGLPQYTTLVVPYSYAVLMASHTFWTSVFFARTPVFQYSGRHGEGQQKEQAVESLAAYQLHVGRMLPVLYSWLYDAGRYGLGVVGMWWAEEVSHIRQIIEREVDQILPGLGQTETEVVEQVIRQRGYEGNRLYNVRPQDFLWDPRVTVRDFQRGEFAIIRRKPGWNEIVKRERLGFYVNIDNIDKDSGSEFSDTINVSDSSLITPDDLSFGEDERQGSTEFEEKKHPDVVPIYECYIELIPKEWKLDDLEFPEKWVFTVTGDFKNVIGVQPLGARHDSFPFMAIEIEPDAYSLANRGMPEILDPVQRTMDWLLNSHFYNTRAALNNQFIADPMMVVMKDVQDPVPGGVIRLKPTAAGRDIRTFFQQLPVVDVTAGHMKDMQIMESIGEKVMGVNDQILGSLDDSGSRKTATEVRSATTFGINRLKTSSEYMSAVGMEPLSQMLLQNSQQYYEANQKLKIVGNLANEAGRGFLQVDQESIQGFFGFIPVDGTLPIDRFAQATLWKDILLGMRQLPQLMQQFDIGRIFMWMAQLAGIRNIDQFLIQVQPDAQVAAQAQQGNVVPMPPREGFNPPPTPKPTQLSGVGPTI